MIFFLSFYIFNLITSQLTLAFAVAISINGKTVHFQIIRDAHTFCKSLPGVGGNAYRMVSWIIKTVAADGAFIKSETTTIQIDEKINAGNNS